MAKYVITAPDGSNYEITAPDGASESSVLAYAKSQFSKQEQPKKEGFGARLQREIENVPRQIGLTARAGIEGALETAGIFTNPIAYGLNQFGMNVPYAQETGQSISNALNLPVPETPTERIAGTGAKYMAGIGGMAGLANRGAQISSGGVKEALSTLGSNPGAQVAGAAGGGTASQYAEESGGGDAAQLAAGVVGGLTGASAVGLANRLNTQISGLIKFAQAKRQGINKAAEAINQAIERNGIKLSDLPKAVQNQLEQEVKVALETGKEIDKNVIRRLTDYAAVGATPTKATVTLDPALVTQQKNLAKIGANSSNKTLQRLAQTQRQNDLTLMQNLDDLGANTPVDRASAGSMLQGSLKASDMPRKSAVDAAYREVRDASGRYANLNTKAFSEAANSALDEGQLGYFLPKEIRSLLNDVSSGNIPFNVNTAQQMDTVLSGASADAFRKGDSRAALAINSVRKSLQGTPIEQQSGVDAMNAYGKAKGLARQRFSIIDKTPALKAALDDEAPDKFIQTYLIGGGNKSNIKDVANLAKELKKDPEAFKVAREQIAAFLKEKALSGGADETANFSAAGYNRAIKSIGDAKLGQFFNPKELAQLKAIGRVASYEKFQPTGSAVNNSNTASAAIGALEKIISGLPFGEMAAVTPIKNIANAVRASNAFKPVNALAFKPQTEIGLPPSIVIPALVQANQ